VLRRVGIPGNLIARELRSVRDDHYRMFREATPSASRPGDLPDGLLEADVETHTLLPGAWAVGRSLQDLHLRGRTGATVIALMQDGQVVPNPEPDRPLAERETLVMMGSFEQIALARHLMDQGPEGSPVRDPLPLQR
jgi:hypothetical protein